MTNTRPKDGVMENKLSMLILDTGNISKLEKIKVISGANKPLKRKSQICEEIHGDSGLGGVDWSDVDKKISSLGINLDEGKQQNIENVVEGIHNAYKNSKNGKLTILVTGCHTSIAAYAQKYPEDIKSGNINVVAMGGSIDTYGNTGPWAEFNIQIDPEAFNIVLNTFQTEDKRSLVTLIPVDVTHTVLSTPEVIQKLDNSNKFENLIIKLLYFFKETYQNVFNFSSPPVHDPVAAYYIVHPEDFEVKHEQAVVEIEGKYIGQVYETDNVGNVLPKLRGEFEVPEGYVLPIATSARSFDGRYSGAITKSEIKARVVPILTW